METCQIVCIPDDVFYYYSDKGIDIVAQECGRVGYQLAWELSTITYKAHTWKAVHGYRIQGVPALWIRIDVYSAVSANPRRIRV